MTWIWVFLGIFGLLALLLTARVIVRLSFQMEDGFSGEVHYLFFHLSFPAPEQSEKNREEKKQKKDKPDKKTSIRDIIKEKGLFGLLEFLSQLASIANGAAKRLLAHFRLNELNIRVTVASEDAATTAVLYGSVGGVVYPAAGTLITAFHCKHYNVQIVPDFEQENCSAQLYLHGRVRLVFLLTAGLYALLRYLKTAVHQKLQENQQKAPAKEENRKQ